MNRFINPFLIAVLLILVSVIPVSAQGNELTSPTFKIIDPIVDSGGGISEAVTNNYSLIQSVGDPTADARLVSGSYSLQSGFPAGIQTNVPLIRCAETNTTSATTSCINFVSGNGAQGECGDPGCYDRAKIEIDPQNNPVDTLYLVSIFDVDNSIQYYLQSDHTIDTIYDINDYQTICDLEGKDTRSGSGCQNSSDPEWDESLQRSNILNLASDTTFSVAVRALQGDFTEGQYSPEVQFSTELPTLSFDLDIGTTASVETSAPYEIDLGLLTPGTVATGTDLIWIDINTNIFEGVETTVRDLHGGLSNGTFTITSSTEDLDIDPGNDGGFGLKLDTLTQTTQGPLISSGNYDSGVVNGVGALSTSEVLIAETEDNLPNRGFLTGGRIGLLVKALVTVATPGGIYTDELTFTASPNV